MYRCVECGKVFEEPDTIQEYRGEFWGAPAYENVDASPCCGADVEEFEPTCEYCSMFTVGKDGQCLCGWLEMEVEKGDEPCKDFELCEEKRYDRGMDRI